MRARAFHRGPIRDADAGLHPEIPAGDPAGCGAGRQGSSSLSAVWRRLKAFDAWLNDNLAGDALALACLVVFILSLFILAGVLQ